MRRHDPRTERLASCPLFSGCDRRQLARIASHTCPARAEEGTVLVREGTRGQEFFVVISGRAVVLQRGTAVATVGPGDFFGEMALLDGGPRTATVVSMEKMELLVANQAEFDTILAEAPVSRRVATAMAHRLRHAPPVAA